MLSHFDFTGLCDFCKLFIPGQYSGVIETHELNVFLVWFTKWLFQNLKHKQQQKHIFILCKQVGIGNLALSRPSGIIR